MPFNHSNAPNGRTGPASAQRNWIQCLIRAGSGFVEGGLELRTLQLTNALAMTYGLLMLPYIVIFGRAGYTGLAFSLSICLVTLVVAVFLMSQGKVFWGKLLLITDTNIAILLFALAFGRQTHIQWLFVPMLIAPCLLFSDFKKSSSTGLVLGTLQPVLLLLGLETGDYAANVLPDGMLQYVRWITIFTMIAGSVCQQMYWRNLLGKHESSINNQKNFLRAVIDNLPVALFCKSYADDLRFVMWNKKAESIWGRKQEEILGKTDLDLFTPKDAETYRQKDLEVLASGTHTLISVESSTAADGSLRLLRTQKVPVLKTYLLGISEDITDLRRVEDENHKISELLKTKNRHLESIFGNLSEGLLLQGDDGRVFQFNESACKILGVSHQELMGAENSDRRWRCVRENGESLPFDEYPAVEVLRTGVGVHNRTIGLYRPNGELRWLNFNVAPFLASDSKKVSQILITFRDITDSKHQSLAIEKANADIKNFFAVSTDMLAVINIDGSFKAFNPKFSQLLGYSDSEIAKSNLLRFVAPEQVQLFSDELRQLLGDKNSTRFTVDCVTATGTRLQISWTFSCSLDKSAIFLSGRDVTDERLQHQRLLQSEKMSSLGEMSAGVAHEINNPLAIIFGKAQQMQKALKGSQPIVKEDLLKASESIEKTAERIAKIIKGLRSFARDATHDPLERIPVQQVIQDILSLCTNRFAHNRIRLEVPTIDEKVQIHCRPAQLSQVLLNLLGNAFDAVQNLEGERWVRIDSEITEKGVNLFVRDNGPGIPKEIRNSIMVPFFTTKAPGKGTGLGLSISSGIVKALGGTLELAPEDPHTCFKLFLPFGTEKNFERSELAS